MKQAGYLRGKKVKPLAHAISKAHSNNLDEYILGALPLGDKRE